MYRTARARLVRGVAAGLLAGSLAACGDSDEGTSDNARSTATTAAKAPTASPTVQIQYVDYGYAVSGPLVAGGTLQLKNAGKELHMMGVGRLKPGKTLDDLRKALSEAGPPGGGPPPQAQAGATTTTTEDRDPTAEVADDMGIPGNIMTPGESAELTVPDLKPGKYALVCFISTEGEGAPHFAKGMVNELTVVEGSAPAPTADLTYTLAAGKAIEGPAAVKPGRHTVKFEAAPGSEKLEPGIARLAAGKTLDDLETALDKLFESEEPPPKGVMSTLPGQLPIALFDLNESRTVYVTMDFAPGTYAIVADDRDKEPRPKPPKEMITVTVS